MQRASELYFKKNGLRTSEIASIASPSPGRELHYRQQGPETPSVHPLNFYATDLGKGPAGDTGLPRGVLIWIQIAICDSN